MIIPQTRQPLQILLHKGLALFSPSTVDKEDRIKVMDYNWKLMDDNGNVCSFEDLKGKVVMVNFWATWCPPCIAEMPSMQKLYNAYKDDMVFLLVSNEDEETIRKFKEKNGYDFKVYTSISMLPTIFNSSSIPKTYLIDQDGTIVIDKTGAADWNSDKVHDIISSLLKI